MVTVSQIQTLTQTPVWVYLSIALVAIISGFVIGCYRARQAKGCAAKIENASRDIQSEFDLLSRDITKVRQDSKKILSNR